MCYYACRIWRKRLTIEQFIGIVVTNIPLVLATTILLVEIEVNGISSFLEVSLLLQINYATTWLKFVFSCINLDHLVEEEDDSSFFKSDVPTLACKALTMMGINMATEVVEKPILDHVIIQGPGASLKSLCKAPINRGRNLVLLFI